MQFRRSAVGVLGRALLVALVIPLLLPVPQTLAGPADRLQEHERPAPGAGSGGDPA